MVELETTAKRKALERRPIRRREQRSGRRPGAGGRAWDKWVTHGPGVPRKKGGRSWQTLAPGEDAGLAPSAAAL